MNPNGGGFAATVLPSERRAGYGAAPPASRVATAIATRRALRPALDPGALYGPSPRSGRRAGAKPLPAQPHGAHDPNPTKQSLYGYRGLPPQPTEHASRPRYDNGSPSHTNAFANSTTRTVNSAIRSPTHTASSRQPHHQRPRHGHRPRRKHPGHAANSPSRPRYVGLLEIAHFPLKFADPLLLSSRGTRPARHPPEPATPSGAATPRRPQPSGRSPASGKHRPVLFEVIEHHLHARSRSQNDRVVLRHDQHPSH